MASKAKKAVRRTFEVSLDMPEGVSVEEMRFYIFDAVGTWKGQEDPESPIFGLDGDSVKVRAVPVKKK